MSARGHEPDRPVRGRAGGLGEAQAGLELLVAELGPGVGLHLDRALERPARLLVAAVREQVAGAADEVVGARQPALGRLAQVVLEIAHPQRAERALAGAQGELQRRQVAALAPRHLGPGLHLDRGAQHRPGALGVTFRDPLARPVEQLARALELDQHAIGVGQAPDQRDRAVGAQARTARQVEGEPQAAGRELGPGIGLQAHGKRQLVVGLRVVGAGHDLRRAGDEVVRPLERELDLLARLGGGRSHRQHQGERGERRDQHAGERHVHPPRHPRTGRWADRRRGHAPGSNAPAMPGALRTGPGR
jgi:hypothetical protein